jgi:gamma-glutamylcyclotransferase
MYYFAYGSNMNFSQMDKRCPGSRFVSTAILHGFKFVYDGTSKKGGAVGNIIKDSEAVVLGGLYEINDTHLSTLNKEEGYPISYNRAEFPVRDEHGNMCYAITYFRTGKQIGEPRPGYRSIVIQGAMDCRLPEEYIVKYLY